MATIRDHAERRMIAIIHGPDDEEQDREMVKLNGTDAAILARVAKYSKVEPVRRRHMLDKASPDAKVIGNIVISRDENGAPDDFIRAAHSIIDWAAEERPERTEVVAHAGH